ncbi:MAG: protein kinase [Planctomycetes bacterium]|nr:protein kinase [Planctomycetota bacterium]
MDAGRERRLHAQILLCRGCDRGYFAEGVAPGQSPPCPVCGAPLRALEVGGTLLVGAVPFGARSPGPHPATTEVTETRVAAQEPPHPLLRPAARPPCATDPTLEATAGPAPPTPTAHPLAGVGAETIETLPPSALPAPRTASPVHAHATQGEPLGRYRLLRVLGRGGMGIVYQAWDGELKRVVALKTLLPEAAPTEKDVDRFLREARAAAGLRHPNVVQVHDVGTDGGRHFFTMDYIEGESLEAAKAHIPPRRFLEILRDVALALHAAHEAGVVHRDVKPANILLDGSGRPYVSDFGLAKEVRGGSREITVTGCVMGTPHYMAPEQAQGRISEIGARTDVWSLGVMLYEQLAGRVPFEAEGVLAVLRAVVDEEPAPPGRAAFAGGRRRRVHRDLETICLKCLEKDASRRYASAGELAADLGRYLEGEPIEARPVSFAARCARKALKHRTISATVAGAAAIVLVALWGTHARGSAYEALLREVARADGLVREGKVEEAVGIYGRLLSKRPALWEARLSRARALLAGGNETEARTDLDETLRLNPASAAALTARGRLRQRQGEAVGALADLKEALRLEPGNFAAAAAHGWLLLDAGERDAADADFAVASGPAAPPSTRATALCGHALCLAARGDDAAALLALNQAVEADARYEGAFLERGRLFARTRRFVQAERDFAEAAGLRPQGIDALLERALARHAFAVDEEAKGEQLAECDRGAVEDCREAAVRAPRDARPPLWEARCSEGLDAALAAVEKALALDPRCGAAWLWQGRLLLEKGEAVADASFERAHGLLPKPAEALAGRAAAALLRQDRKAALRFAEAAIAEDPTCAEAHGCRAEALHLQGEHEAARSEYELCERLAREVEVDGIGFERIESLWRKHSEIVQRYYDLEELEWTGVKLVRAGRWLERACPHFAGAILWQARGLWMSGEFDRALEKAAAALRRNPYAVEAYLLQARLRLDVDRLRDPRAALADAMSAAALAPDEPRALERMARAWQLLGLPERALAELERALKLAPSLAVLHVRKAQSLRALGLEGPAREADARARAGKPDERAVQEYVLVACLLRLRQKYDFAIPLCERALEEAPRSAAVLTLHGECSWSCGRIDAFFQDYAHAMELYPAASVNLFYNAEQAFTQTRVSTAFIEPMLFKLLEAHPDDAAMQAMGGVWYYLQGDWHRAMGFVERGLSVNPDFAVLYALRGSLRAHLGDLAHAASDIAEGMRRAPHGGMTNYFEAQFAALRGDKRKALALLAACVDRDFYGYTDFVRRDPAFAAISADPDFERALQRRQGK